MNHRHVEGESNPTSSSAPMTYRGLHLAKPREIGLIRKRTDAGQQEGDGETGTTASLKKTKTSENDERTDTDKDIPRSRSTGTEREQDTLQEHIEGRRAMDKAEGVPVARGEGGQPSQKSVAMRDQGTGEKKGKKEGEAPPNGRQKAKLLVTYDNNRKKFTKIKETEHQKEATNSEDGQKNESTKDDHHRRTLQGNLDRMTLYPIIDNDVWNLYQKMLEVFWIPKEIGWVRDKMDFEENLQHWEKQLLIYLMGFWMEADAIVIGSLENVWDDIFIGMECKICYNFQLAMEGIHLEVYSDMLENIIVTDVDRHTVRENTRKNETLCQRAEFIQQKIRNSNTRWEKLIIFTLLEGVSFSTSFALVYWYKEKGLLPGLVGANEYIARDERMHTELGILLLKTELGKLSTEKSNLARTRIYADFREYYELEKAFYKKIFDDIPASPITLQDTEKYIGVIMDNILQDIGLEKIWNTTITWNWVNIGLLTGKTDFFIRKPTEYKRKRNSTIVECFSQISEDSQETEEL